MSQARSSADPVAGSARADLVEGSVRADPMACSAAASVGLGVGVWLAASSTCVCVGGGACCVAPPPMWPFATTPWLSPQWHSTNVLPPCTVSPRCRIASTFATAPFTVCTTTPFSTPCRYGTHTGGLAPHYDPDMPHCEEGNPNGQRKLRHTGCVNIFLWLAPSHGIS